MFDFHIHLARLPHPKQLTQLLYNGDYGFIAIACEPWEWESTANLKKEFSTENKPFKTSYGIHPMIATQVSDADFERLKEYLQADRSASVGECGLDKRYPGYGENGVQEAVFKRQIELAKALGRDLQIHCVGDYGSAFEFVLAHIVFITTTLCDFHLAVIDSNVDIAAFLMVRQPRMPVALLNLEVTHLYFGTFRHRTILDNHVEPLGIVRRLPQGHTASGRCIFAAKVLRLLQESGEFGTFHEYLSVFTINRNKGRRVLGIAGTPRYIALSHILDFLLSIFTNNFTTFFFYTDTLDRIFRNRKFCNPVGQGKCSDRFTTIIFREGTLNNHQSLKIDNPIIKKKVEEWCSKTTNLDYRFVYYLLGAKGICVVPSTSFCTDLKGFRVTLLEEDEDELRSVFTTIHDAIVEYLHS